MPENVNILGFKFRFCNINKLGNYFWTQKWALILAIVLQTYSLLEMSPSFIHDSLNARREADPLKPCRACTDFKTWTKMQSTKSETQNASASTQNTSEKGGGNRVGCPVDRDELGAATWTFLHTMAAYYPEKPSTDEKKQMKQFIKFFSNFYPCDTCASNFRTEIAQDPVAKAVESQHTLSQWFCRMHNNVNLRLGKPIFDCSKVNQRWKDGWLDGSCD